MMGMNERLIEVKEYTKDGYKPVVDFGAWRVAFLNYAEDLLVQNIDKLQCHKETDEVFVLLKGKCILFAAEGGDGISGIEAVDMEPLKVYNVKRGIWHSHTLSRDASVLIVENRDTTLENSPFIDLSAAQKQRIADLYGELWK